LAGVIAALDPGWTANDADNNFDAGTKSKITVLSQLVNGTSNYLVAFDPSLGVPKNQFAFGTSVPNADGTTYTALTQVRGVKKYIAMEYSSNTQYFTVSDFVKFVQGAAPSSLATKLGSYSNPPGTMDGVSNMDVATDIMTHYMNVSAGDLQKIKERVTKHSMGAAYTMQGKVSSALFLRPFDGNPAGGTLWPKEIKSGDTGDNDGMTGLRGPGTAVDLTGGKKDAGGYKDSITIVPHQLQRVQPAQDDIALYTGDVDESVKGKPETDTEWCVEFDYKASDGSLNQSGCKFIFGGPGRPISSLPSGYGMQGLGGVTVPVSGGNPQLMLLNGSTPTGGAIVLYLNGLPGAGGATNLKNPAANCGGPLIWWGSVTKDMAQAACPKGSL
jgi:hypothetical protein